jgi:hypothetical protein
VARQLGSSARAPQPRRIAFVAHCHGVSDMGDSRELHLFADGYCELVPVGGGMTSITIVVPATPTPTRSAHTGWLRIVGLGRAASVRSCLQHCAWPGHLPRMAHAPTVRGPPAPAW